MTSKECGEFIAVMRKENGLTQKELAEELNVTDKAVSRWETGKGYPDVSSLMALSDYFEISVNELLAGKRIDAEEIKEITDENIISVIKESENTKKRQTVKLILYIVVLLLMLMPALIEIIKEMSVISVTQIEYENIFPAIGEMIVAVWLLLSGIITGKGNVSLIHSYHYKNVTDFDAYSKEMGSTFMLMSIPLFISGILTLFAHIKTVEIIGAVVLFGGLIICFICIFKVQIKHNGGLF